MALLNPPQILPHAIRPILAWLAQDADGRHAFDAIADALAPASLAPSPIDSRDTRPANLFHTLATTVNLGMVQRDGQHYQLDPSISRDVPQWTHDDLRVELRKRVLAPERNEQLWDGDVGAKDLTRALAWFLAQTPYRGHVWSVDAVETPYRRIQMTQRQQLLAGTDATLIANNTRWDAFQRWSVYLGFAQRQASSVGSQSAVTVLVPDPTAAVRPTALDVLSRYTESVPVKTFLDDLAGALPVVDGGRYRMEVEERMTPTAIGEEDAVSPPLALALLRLDGEKVIQLERRADPGRGAIRLTTVSPGVGPLCARIAPVRKARKRRKGAR